MNVTEKTKTFNDIEKFCIITFDEMKIAESLVWDKNTSELNGYVDLDSEHINHATFKKRETIASHVLVF